MLCRNCGCYTEDDAIVCPECGQILPSRSMTSDGGIEAIRQGKRAREARKNNPVKKAEAEVRRRRRSGASRATIQMPAIEDSRPDPNEYYESYLDPEEKENKSPNSSGIERKAKAVYSDQNSRQANLSAYAAKNPPQAMQRKMVNWVKVGFVAFSLLILFIVGIWLFLKNTESGQKLMARMGRDAPSSAYWRVGEEMLDNGDIESAIKEFEKARALDQENDVVDVDGLLLLGNAYEANEETEKAAQLYEEIYTETPSRSEAYVNHIRILLNSDKPGDKAKAGELMNTAYINTGDADFFTQRSDLLPAPPEVDLTGGFYESKKRIEIYSYQGYDVYYTFDENAKLPYGGIKYTSRVLLDEGTHTLRAVAVNGELVSDELHGTYKIIMPSPQTPRSSLAPNTYKQRQRIWLKPGLDNEKDTDIIIYYTIDGSPPDADSPRYTGEPFWLPGGWVTLKAVAVNKYSKVSNTLEVLYKIEAKPFPKAAYSSSSDRPKDFTLYITTMTDFQQIYGQGELAGNITLPDLDTECRRYDYAWGYAVMSKTKKAWVVAEVCITGDGPIPGPRSTKIGEAENSIIDKFRDMGQVASESGNRGLYATKEGTGKIWKQTDGTDIIRYICNTEDNHRWQLEYRINSSGNVSSIDMLYLP